MRAIEIAITIIVFCLMAGLLGAYFNVSTPTPEVNSTIQSMRSEVESLANTTDIPVVGSIIAGAKALRMFLKAIWLGFTLPYNLLVSYGCPKPIASVVQALITLALALGVVQFLRGRIPG